MSGQLDTVTVNSNLPCLYVPLTFTYCTYSVHDVLPVILYVLDVFQQTLETSISLDPSLRSATPFSVTTQPRISVPPTFDYTRLTDKFRRSDIETRIINPLPDFIT